MTWREKRSEACKKRWKKCHYPKNLSKSLTVYIEKKPLALQLQEFYRIQYLCCSKLDYQITIYIFILY